MVRIAKVEEVRLLFQGTGYDGFVYMRCVMHVCHLFVTNLKVWKQGIYCHA